MRNKDFKIIKFIKNNEISVGILFNQDNEEIFSVYDISDLARVNEIYSKNFFIEASELADRIFSNPVEYEGLIISKEAVIPPLPQPKNIVAVGMNYKEHSHEVKLKQIYIFPKNIELTSPYSKIIKPPEALLDWEVELGVVIRSKIDEDTNITYENIADYIAGFVLVNDLSDRRFMFGLKERITGFTASKTFPTFLPVGPFFVPIENFKLDPEGLPNLEMKLWVNGDLRQQVNTSEMLVSYIKLIKDRILKEKNKIWLDSEKKEYPLMTTEALMPGDLILTGTPGGTAVKSPGMVEMLGLIFRSIFKFNFNPGIEVLNIECKRQREDKKPFFWRTRYKYLEMGDIVKSTISGLGTQAFEISE